MKLYNFLSRLFYRIVSLFLIAHPKRNNLIVSVKKIDDGKHTYDYNIISTGMFTYNDLKAVEAVVSVLIDNHIQINKMNSIISETNSILKPNLKPLKK